MYKLVITLTAVAATIVPAAQSAGNQIGSPDDRSQARATSSALLPGSPNPDDRTFNRATSPVLQPQSLGADDRALPRATVDVRRAPAPVQVIVRQPRGFDWVDATTGAVAAGGFAAILAALSLIARSRRSEAPGATPTVESA
ncbi:MAG: hypothetical protein ABI896_03610 [Actinomycetota bacterium]